MVKLFRLMNGLVPTMLLFAMYCPLQATTLFFSGNLRTDASDTSCGQNCTLGAANSADDYAQYAAVINTFVVSTTTTMEAITYSYAGNVSRNGTTVTAGGLEPYLSLFDSSGDFLASTYLGTTCPAGSHTLNGNCFDVALDGGTLTPGTYEIALTAYANMSLAENNGAPTNSPTALQALELLRLVKTSTSPSMSFFHRT